MYELKKIGKVFTSKSVVTGPSSCGKNNLPGRGLTQVGKHWPTAFIFPLHGSQHVECLKQYGMNTS